ncbi:MAG: hypothetical protein WCW40_02415 [Bacteroidota bacterium]
MNTTQDSKTIFYNSMKPLFLKIALIVVILFSLQCQKNETVAPTEGSLVDFSGTVLDNKGNPVQGASIHFIYSLADSSLGKNEGSAVDTRIMFSVPNRQFVTLKTQRWYPRADVETIINDTLLSGIYTYTLNSPLYTNGLYYVDLMIGSYFHEKYIAVMKTDVDSLTTSVPLCTTNSSGTFELSFLVFGFRYPLDLLSEKDGTLLRRAYISHSMQIVIYKPGYKTIVKSLVINEKQPIKETFSFE